MLLATLLDIKESYKDNIEIIGMKDGSIKLDSQTNLKKHLAFLADNLFLNNSMDKKTDRKDYFLFIPVVASNDSSIKVISTP